MPARSDEPIIAKCFHPSGNFVEFPKEDVERSIPERFEKIVRIYPNRIAIQMSDRVVTYDELNKLANRIAQAVIVQVGTSQRPVSLLLDPGIEAIAVMLGALKAGKCYVPLDPSFPTGTIRAMLEDSQADLVVTNIEKGAMLAPAIGTGVSVLNVDDLPAGRCEEPQKRFLSPHTPSFIIYTSGSTGRPKGVLHTHRTALHTVLSLTNLVHVCAEDRIALLLSHSFSASIRQVFGALLNGGALLPFNTNREGIAPVVNWLAREAVSLCGFTGSMFRHFLLQLVDAKKTYPSLRVCFVGSESISKSDLELYKAWLPDHTLIVANMGTNETGGIGNLLIDKSSEIPGTIVPAGYAQDDKEIILLDEAGEKVGFDTPGEIAVKSEYLSPGYWRQPELTATKFISDSDGAKRIYLTGDLGRMTPDGRLFFLGRKDFTVKIRGYNVETPKVEMALLEHPGVKHAAVTSRQGLDGDVRLVAYIVPASLSCPSNDELRRLLKEKLPGYMIPSIYVVLEALPTTPSGKIDRKALPETSHSRPELDVSYVSYRSEIEKQLVAIWEDVLGVRPIGIHDRFFDLGGHSLTASRIVSAVLHHCHLEIPLGILLSSPTVAEMAAVVVEHQAGQLGKQELDDILAELESMPEEQAKRLVNENLRTETKK